MQRLAFTISYFATHFRSASFHVYNNRLYIFSHATYRHIIAALTRALFIRRYVLWYGATFQTMHHITRGKM